jgi:phosphatidylglycerophosphate synthase
MTRLPRIEPPWDQRLARLMVGPLRRAPITPNAITTLTIVFGLLGAWLLAGAGAGLGAALVMIAFLLDHADGELARLTGRTSVFGHYYDLFADALVTSALFVGIGLGLDAGGFGVSAARLGLIAGAGIALAILFRMELERRAGKTAVRQPNLLGFEAQDVLYLIGPVTWLGGLKTWLMLAAIGAPLYALVALWELGRHLWGRPPVAAAVTGAALDAQRVRERG